MNKPILLLACWLLGSLSGMAQQRKMADIQHLADSVLSQPARWGSKTKAKTIKTNRVIAASELLDNQQDAFYVCDAGTNGFAIISADERMSPVLGYSQDASLDTENIPAGMKELLNSYAKEYEGLRNGSPQKLVRRHIEGVQEQVGPLLTTEWGQAEPYNNRCPEWQGERCITGCVAVSTGQVMRYYQYPDSAKGEVDYTTLSYGIPIKEDLSAFHFDWPNIRNQYYNGASETEKNAVADLLYACAAAVKMDFGIKGSSATSTNQVKALVENFGYDPDIACIHKDYMTTNEWQTIMLNELNAESPRPIIYAAVTPEKEGHSFIIDGYKADEDAYPYYHINWGWKGFCDGYFKLSSLDADDQEFSQNHEAIIFIQPTNDEQDSDYFLQAQEVILSSARINPNDTHQFSVTMKVFNYSYKTFRGRIEVYLKNDKGEEILVGTNQDSNNGIALGYGLSTTIRATLPNDIKEGDYTLIIRSKAYNSENRETVTYSSPQTLTVTTITESYTPVMMVSSLLNVGEDLEGLSVSVQASWPMNFTSRTFTGTLRMAVADDEGNLLTPFGNVANINNLAYGYIQQKAYTFTGKLPDYLEDGKYRLYLAANQSGYLEWGKVTGYKMETGKFQEEIFIPFWLEDGKVIYHKEGEEELPEFYANLQVTDMQITAFQPETRHIEMQIVNLANFGEEAFIGQLSMVVYNDANTLKTAFGDPQKINSPIAYYKYLSKIFDFSGNLPEDLEDGNYTVKIAAKQNGCRGWSPLKGWELSDGYITQRDIDLAFGFIILNNKMYKVDTDGMMAPIGKTEQGPIYNLSGQRINSQHPKGIYIVNGRKTVK